MGGEGQAVRVGGEGLTRGGGGLSSGDEEAEAGPYSVVERHRCRRVPRYLRSPALQV